MPYKIRKQKCTQSDNDKGNYVLSYTDKKNKKHHNCHTTKEKAQNQIAAIEIESDILKSNSSLLILDEADIDKLIAQAIGVQESKNMTKSQLKNIGMLDEPRMFYNDIRLTKSSWVREYNECISEDDLVWQLGKSNRKITVLEGNGWKLQRDNELPQEAQDGDILEIHAGEWHRIIAGSGNFKLLIQDIEGSNTDQMNQMNEGSEKRQSWLVDLAQASDVGDILGIAGTGLDAGIGENASGTISMINLTRTESKNLYELGKELWRDGDAPDSDVSENLERERELMIAGILLSIERGLLTTDQAWSYIYTYGSSLWQNWAKTSPVMDLAIKLFGEKVISDSPKSGVLAELAWCALAINESGAKAERVDQKGKDIVVNGAGIECKWSRTGAWNTQFQTSVPKDDISYLIGRLKGSTVEWIIIPGTNLRSALVNPDVTNLEDLARSIDTEIQTDQTGKLLTPLKISKKHFFHGLT